MKAPLRFGQQAGDGARRATKFANRVQNMQKLHQNSQKQVFIVSYLKLLLIFAKH
jgi:hypothetical protein